MKTIFLLLALCAFPASVCAQISVANFATGRGIVAPGAVAVITGSGFAVDHYYTNQPGELPKDLGGVQVTVGKHLAGLRIVELDRIVCVVPGDAPLGWQHVEVLTPGGNQRGWALIAHVAPGIFIENGHPQGLFNSGKLVGIVGPQGVIPGARVGLTTTGFKRAREIIAYFVTDDGWFAVFANAGPFAVPMAGLETVYFDLPESARGKARVIFWADGHLSNEVFLTVR